MQKNEYVLCSCTIIFISEVGRTKVLYFETLADKYIKAIIDFLRFHEISNKNFRNLLKYSE